MSSGLKTAMVEKFDFASGTSSRSTKLIHGGVRYLQKAIMGFDIEQVVYLPTAREGNVFTGVCLSTIRLMDTGLLLDLVTARSVRILLKCFLV